MRKIVECVPNFSEGRDERVIAAIADALRSVDGVRLLDVDPGAGTNRTVYTLAGEPEAALEAAFRGVRKGLELIDMSKHRGEHARQGACDVCPFVPISGVTMADCVALAERLGRRIGEELGVPVYLYAAAATSPRRRRLPDIREGEYEALPEKLKRPEWKPDFGPAEFVARSGAVTVGARDFLIAYNVNLNTKSVALAKRIALEIRETGRIKRDAKGAPVLGIDGKPERVPGLFKGVQGTGWLIPEYGRAQVTVNILDLEAAPLHKIYDACCELADKFGCRVTGSEIVGMLPKRVLTEAGRHFLKKQGATTGVSESELIRTAALSLGLSDVVPFDPAKKIIEEQFSGEDRLASMSVKAFAEELAADSPAPGGGSAAALAGGLGAGLIAMVASLSHAKRGFEALKGELEALGVEAERLLASGLEAVDADAAAFSRLMAASRLPVRSKEERAARDKAVRAAGKDAARVPLETLARVPAALELARRAAEKGSPSAFSDAGVAASLLRAAAMGAYYNVLINLPGISDAAWRRKTRAQADRELAASLKKAAALEKAVLKKLRAAA